MVTQHFNISRPWKMNVKILTPKCVISKRTSECYISYEQINRSLQNINFGFLSSVLTFCCFLCVFLKEINHDKFKSTSHWNPVRRHHVFCPSFVRHGGHGGAPGNLQNWNNPLGDAAKSMLKIVRIKPKHTGNISNLLGSRCSFEMGNFGSKLRGKY